MKTKELQKCHICLKLYQPEKVDKHMHSRVHHEAMEMLEGGLHMHKCWACELSFPGLELYVHHISTGGHGNKMHHLEQKRRSGGDEFTLDYNDDEMNALCAKRDQQRPQKTKKKKQKKKTAKKAFHQRKRNKTWIGFFDPTRADFPNWMQPPWSDDQNCIQMTPNVEYPLGDGSYNYHMQADQSMTQVRSWNNFSQESGTCYLRGEVDFTSDQYPEFDFSSPWQNRSQERLDEPGGSDLANVSAVTSTQGGCSSSNETKSPLASSDNATNTHGTSRLVRHHMNRVSVMLTNTCNEELLSGASVGKVNSSKVSHGNSNGKSNEKQSAIPRLSERHPQKPSPVCPPGRTVFSKTGQACKNDKLSPRKRLSVTLNKLPTFTRKALNETGEDPRLEPSQSKNVLPTLLSRSVSKTEANKPNLKVARGIRTSQKPNKPGESRVLKPALQKLISSKSAQWRVNWKEIYLEATNRKLQKEKGMPRFGIDFVSPLPPEPKESAGEEVEDVVLDEGFQWESVQSGVINVPLSVIPLTKDTCGSQSECSLPFAAPGCESRVGGTSRTNHALLPVETVPSTNVQTERVKPNKGASRKRRTSEPSTDRSTKVDHKAEWEKSSNSAFKTPSELMLDNSLVFVKAEQPDDFCLEQLQSNADLNRMDFIPVRKAKQEKRVVPDDILLDKNPPQRQNSGQVRNLLTMSLREEELNSTLQDVDGRLSRAQAALQTAFIEVQRLQMCKQQVNAEMTSLRAKRIEILQRIQSSRHGDTSSADPTNSASLSDQREPKSSRPQHETPLDHSPLEPPDRVCNTEQSSRLSPAHDLSAQTASHSLAKPTAPARHDPPCSVHVQSDPGSVPEGQVCNTYI